MTWNSSACSIAALQFLDVRPPRADASHNTDGDGPWRECQYLMAPTFDAFLDGLVFEVGDRDDECSRIDGVDHEAARERSRAVAQSVKGTSITTRRR